MNSKDRGLLCLSVITVAVIGWYVLLCTVHYFNQRPMWNDEECVFRSIQAFSAQDMFAKPLMAIQVFPRLYLYSIQSISRLFDFHLLSLRILPFLAMMSAFFIWIKLAGYEFKNKLDRLTFILSWPASALLIYYSAELKQYSMDVLTAAVFLLFLYNQERLEEDHKTLYGFILLLLPVLGMFSYTAFLFMGLPLYNLVLSARKNRFYIRFIAMYAVSFAVFVTTSYVFDMRFGHSHGAVEGYGDYFISFQSVGEFFKTFGEGTMNLFSRWFAERPRIIKKTAIFFLVFGLIDMFYAFFKNIKKDGYAFKSINTIALVLFAELFLMGALKKYPFSVPRTSLFFCPVVLCLTVKGIVEVKQINKYIYGVIHGLYVIFLIFMTTALARQIFGGDLGAMPKLW